VIADVRVAFSPETVPAIGSGTCAVVIDVLRATTSLTLARLHGAREVEALATPEEALRKRVPGDVLACGERDGRIVPGFDLGNSPFEYTAERVAGKRLAFASTNGSRAILAARRAHRRMLAAFVNLAAVVESLVAETDVVIVCAGKLGEFCLEDAACAGLLGARLEQRGARFRNAASRCARAIAPDDAAAVRALVEGSAHGRALRQLGAPFARDVAFCAGLDTVEAAFDVEA
jgi:2-phosphosulfolactate phosphatase